jgi:hypothetical protein
MIQLIIAFGCGVVVASVAWFFVWRNNKQLIKDQAEKLDATVTEKLSEVKEKINDWDTTE